MAFFGAVGIAGLYIGLCPFLRHLHSVAWLICISNALMSMRNNDSNSTERLSEKTDHGSMRFGHIRDNVQAMRPNLIFVLPSRHFDF